MLLKLDMKFAEPSGDSIKKCTILKCHKQEGDRVEAGDPLFDIQVHEILIPLRLGSAWKETDWLRRYLGEIGDQVTRHLEGKERQKPKTQESDFPVLKDYPRQIVARETGIVCKLYSEEGVLHTLGEPMALMATSERGAIDADDEAASPQTPAFRTALRDLDLDDVLNRWSEKVKATSERGRQYAERDYTIFWSKERPEERRFGILAKGGCDLISMKACQPLIEKVLKGTCCLKIDDNIANGSCDLLLQTLRDDLPWEFIDEVVEKLRLNPAAFKPEIFQKTLAVDGAEGLQEFPINVVILGYGSDLTRTLYRHREHNFLVDPGSSWLKKEGLERLLHELNLVTWFRSNFVRAPNITVEQYVESLTTVIKRIRESSGAHVLVLNQLTVDPVDLMHNYQFTKDPMLVRRLEFKLALIEVSRRLDVPIIDVDRIAKLAGLRTMRDIVHFHPKVAFLIAQQAFEILQDLEVF